MKKNSLLLNQSCSGGTTLIKVSCIYINLDFLLENEVFYLKITNWIALLTFAWSLAKMEQKGCLPPDNPIVFSLHFYPAQLSHFHYAGPQFNSIITQWRSAIKRGGTKHVPGCYLFHGFPFIRRHQASLSFFLQMKFLSHHQGEARATWTRYATSGKIKEICKLNSLFIGIIGSHQLLIL